MPIRACRLHGISTRDIARRNHQGEGTIMVRIARRGRGEPGATSDLIDFIRDDARPLREARDLDPLIARIGDARLVLLGEASHGTSEYYTWRAEITRRLIVEKGFQFLAV